MNKNKSHTKIEQALDASGYSKNSLNDVIKIFYNLLESIRSPLIVLDADFKVIKANTPFYETFEVEPDNTEDMLIYDLGNRQWDIPRLRELLEDILPSNSKFNDFEVEHNFETIGRKIMHLNARRIYGESKQTQMVLLSIEDVTDREYYKRHLEEIVEKRTAEISIAMEEAERRKQIA
jgi:chemotaxis protein methyltransferase CheR